VISGGLIKRRGVNMSSFISVQESARQQAVLKARIKELEVELAEKEAVILSLCEDLNYYRKDLEEQMLQDQGLEE